MDAERIEQPARVRGFSLLELTISATILSGVFYMALSGYSASLRTSAVGDAHLEAMVNSARAMTNMNLELQEASLRDETVEIYRIDAATGQLTGLPADPAMVPPPDTIYPTSNTVGTDSYALRFMTVGDFTSVGDSMEVEEAGPFVYRLGTGAANDFPRDKLVRIDQSGADDPRVLCRGVQQVIFQRDARGGALLITLVTVGRDRLSGQQIATRQVITVMPKNDFSANLANYDLNGGVF